MTVRPAASHEKAGIRTFGGHYHDLQEPYRYLIFTIGTAAYVKDGVTQQVTTFATHGAALQWAINQAGALGGTTTTVIILKPPFSTTDTITILDTCFITIKTDLNQQTYSDASPPPVYIRKIYIHSVAAHVLGITLQGLFIQELYFNSANNIEQVRVIDTTILQTAQANRQGIIFEQTGGSTIDMIYFRGCALHTFQTPAADYGMITFKATGNGWVHFDDCYWYPDDDNVLFIHGQANVQFGHVIVNNLIVQGGQSSGKVLVDTAASNSVQQGTVDVKFIGGFWEGNSMTLVQVAAATGNTTRINVEFIGVTFDPYNGQTYTLLNNLNITPDTTWTNKISFIGCTKINVGTIAIGTTNLRTGLSILINDCIGINPLNKVVNCFDNTNYFIKTDGAAAVPVASQDYVVECAGILITAADSANANNAIIIKDGAGNAITAAAHTLSGVYVPHGYKINWGAFTGAAGACTVCFL